jgi:hypothetical protein
MSVRLFPANALESGLVPLLRHKLSTFLAALGEVLLAHDLSLELGPVADGGVTVAVSARCVGSHGTFLLFTETHRDRNVAFCAATR